MPNLKNPLHTVFVYRDINKVVSISIVTFLLCAISNATRHTELP